MRGRKPKEGATRRGGLAPLQVVQTTPAEAPRAEKPPEVAAVPSQSALWDAVVGDGHAYASSDVPALTQLVTWMDVAAQCRARMLTEGGSMATVIGVGPKGPDGRRVRSAPNPYFRQMEVATNMVMRLSDQLGCTPLARARIGLTQAARASTHADIAAKVQAIMAAQGRDGGPSR